MSSSHIRTEHMVELTIPFIFAAKSLTILAKIYLILERVSLSLVKVPMELLEFLCVCGLYVFISMSNNININMAIKLHSIISRNKNFRQIACIDKIESQESVGVNVKLFKNIKCMSEYVIKSKNFKIKLKYNIIKVTSFKVLKDELNNKQIVSSGVGRTGVWLVTAGVVVTGLKHGGGATWANCWLTLLQFSYETTHKVRKKIYDE